MRQKYIIAALVTVLAAAWGGYAAYEKYVSDYVYDGVRYVNGVPAGLANPEEAERRLSEAVKKSEVSEWKTYRSERYGIEFKYPPRFSEVPPRFERTSPVVSLAHFKDSSRAYSPSSVPDEEIVVNRYALAPGQAFEEALLKETVFDASGAHPESLARFTKRKLGEYEFYSIRTGRFEGTLGFAYYLIAPPHVYRFDAIAQGVDWMNPNLDEGDDPTHAALRHILETLTFSK